MSRYPDPKTVPCFICGRLQRDHTRREWRRCINTPLPIQIVR